MSFFKGPRIHAHAHVFDPGDAETRPYGPQDGLVQANMARLAKATSRTRAASPAQKRGASDATKKPLPWTKTRFPQTVVAVVAEGGSYSCLWS